MRAQDCATVEDLADLILQSSSTPPFTPVLRRNGRPVLDGGMVDNVPVGALDADAPGNVLVMVTHAFIRGRRCSWCRTACSSASMCSRRAKCRSRAGDYTSSSQMVHAYNLGRADGETFLERMPDLLEFAA